MVEYHPISTWDQSRLHQIGKKVLRGIFLGCELIAGGICKGEILILGSFGNDGCIRNSSRRSSAKEVLASQKWETRRRFLQKAPGTKLKKIRRGILQKSALHEHGPRVAKFGERSHEETLTQERCARKAAWGSAKNIYNLKNAGKTTFCTPIEAKVTLAPSSTSPEEREHIVDSGASIHMLSKKESSSEELDTLRRSRNPTVVLTANGELHTHEDAQVYVHDLNLFVTVQLLEDTRAVLSLGKLCEEHGYSFEWVSGQKPRLTKEHKTIVCKTDNIVLLVFSRVIHQFWEQFVVNIDIAGLVFNKCSPRAKWLTSSTKVVRITLRNYKKIQSGTTACEIFLHGWRSLQIFKRTQNCKHPHTFLRTQIRNVLRKWYQNQGSIVCWKFWWLDNGWSQSPQCGRWNSKQSPIRSRGTRSCHSMGSIRSVQNKDFSGNTKEFAKVLGAK